MKEILLAIFQLLFFISFSLAQIPYSAPFTAGLNGWTLAPGGNFALNYSCGALTTSTSTNSPTCTNWNAYSNATTSTATSPASLDFSSCNAYNTTSIYVTYTLNGILENTYDYLDFQYSINNGTTWVNVASFTGNQAGLRTHVLPNTANRFRFRLRTDGTVNAYYCPFPFTCIYFYDINNFTVNCASVILPIELLSFTGEKYSGYNLLKWKTASENNNDYFTIDRSTDGINWFEVTTVPGAGNSNFEMDYEARDYTADPLINYYRLTQTDFNGHEESFPIIVIDNTILPKEVIKITNFIGQEVEENFEGLRIIYYKDGSIEKKVGK